MSYELIACLYSWKFWRSQCSFLKLNCYIDCRYLIQWRAIAFDVDCEYLQDITAVFK
ncbi:hypothetical protein [Nostoc sp. LPT]|uniref:hypothetical protein n=1 Tax=Nostoc sp. LPT TaxID=2815387 RepID=UPI001DB76FF7|nr:hypothetical protein [Nostoc sp. LPT]MBN4003266.1 hypothetical protein [Nostoc sp. LPT]